MPYPKNFEVAKTVEDTVRKAGAIPATIAIIKGVPTVGLTEQEILALAKSNSVLKASTKDISYACAKGLHAATTVASTMRIAHLAGISVFATGGIGGVHRGAEVTMDVSADLLELSRNPVTVVCAGIKSILDIAKTLEVLETYSVPAVGYKCDEFPAFFTNNSGIRSPLRADTAREVAQMMMYNRKLELSSGILLAVPNINPANSEKMQYAIDFAIRSAEGEGIKGAAITPYLLAKIEKLTSGESLESNVALILNNARIASEIAKEHAGMGSKIFINDNFAAQLDNIGGNGKPSEGSEIFMSTSIEDASIKPKDGVLGIDLGNTEERESLDSVDVKRVICSSAYGRSNDVVVVGGAVIDMIGNISTHAIFKSSNPGTVRTSYGGVGRNIAEMVNNTGVNVCLATAVADDIGGRNMLEYTEKKGIDTSFIKVLPTDGAEDSIKTATAVYNAIHDNSGDLCLGIADMNIFKQINTHYIKTISETIQKSRIVVVDANITPDAFKTLATVCTHYNVPIFFEPTSDHKCLLFFHAGCIDKV